MEHVKNLYPEQQGVQPLSPQAGAPLRSLEVGPWTAHHALRVQARDMETAPTHAYARVFTAESFTTAPEKKPRDVCVMEEETNGGVSVPPTDEPQTRGAEEEARHEGTQGLRASDSAERADRADRRRVVAARAAGGGGGGKVGGVGGAGGAGRGAGGGRQGSWGAGRGAGGGEGSWGAAGGGGSWRELGVWEELGELGGAGGCRGRQGSWGDCQWSGFFPVGRKGCKTGHCDCCMAL